jgi:hypothetical protein
LIVGLLAWAKKYSSSTGRIQRSWYSQLHLQAQWTRSRMISLTLKTSRICQTTKKEWQTWLQFECLRNKNTGNSTYAIYTYLLCYRDGECMFGRMWNKSLFIYLKRDFNWTWKWKNRWRGEQKEKSDGKGKGTSIGNGRGNEVDKEWARPHWSEGSLQSAVHPCLN